MRFIGFLSVLLLVTGCDANDNPYQATVESGEAQLIAAPVFMEVRGQALSEEAAICVSADGERFPGQIERLSNDRAKIWWMVDQPAETSRTYLVELNQSCGEGGFSWQSISDAATELVFDGSPVIRYEHPQFDPEDIEGTKKPYHHVYSPGGDRLITKGLGGLYPHHRGIYFGYNHVHLGDDRVDIWHASDGEHSVHTQFLETMEGPVMGGHVVAINWNDRDGETFIEERREIRVFRQPDGQSLIDLKSTLESVRGTIRLDGDRQHAGVQFRAAQYVAENAEETRFMRPAGFDDLPSDEEINSDDHVGLPWNAFQFPVEDGQYTVAYMSHPTNPADAEMSERRYGRFGEFFPYELDENNPLTVRYRFWIAGHDTVSRAEIQDRYQAYADGPRVVVH